MDEVTHVLLAIGFAIMLGVAGRFDCDTLNGVASPSMIGWIGAGIALVVPEIVWFLHMVKKAKEMDE